MKKLRTVVFTSIRSDYGPLRPLLEILQNDADFDFSMLVSGGHLSERFGYTKKDIVADKRPIAAEFDFLVEPPEGDYITKSMARLQGQVGEWFYNNRPDWLVVLGDRFELLPVISAALIYRIPVAHISGGDVTEGAVDNQVRNAVTKMAHAHFPATLEAKNNLLAMGEEEWRICQSGEPALDQIIGIEQIPKDELFGELGLRTDMPTLVMTFHTDTLTMNISPALVADVITGLLGQGYQLLVTGSNFDEGGAEINTRLQEMEGQHAHMHFRMSLGQKRYYSMLKYAQMVVGNSSSGIIEVQSYNIPAVNVGSRQLGRLANPNVLHVEANARAVLDGVAHAKTAAFKAGYDGKANIYGDGKACRRIADFLKNIPRNNLLAKR